MSIIKNNTTSNLLSSMYYSKITKLTFTGSLHLQFTTNQVRLADNLNLTLEVFSDLRLRYEVTCCLLHLENDNAHRGKRLMHCNMKHHDN